MTPYERANQFRYLATDGREGMAIPLPGRTGRGGGTFWSRGWLGCPRCGRRYHDPVELVPFEEVREGQLVTGRRCAP
ncbi:MAG: hypothetical protein AB7N73_14460, partial [Gemmatimonadales bacterium]